MRVSRVARRTSRDALAAHAVLGRRRLAARELGERAQQPRRWRRGARRSTRKQSASSGSCANVRTTQPRSARLREDVGHRRAREHEVAGLRRAPRRRPCACPRRASRAPRRCAAQRSRISSRLAAGELGHGGRPRRDRAGRAQRVERLGERGLREAVADARGAEREALRERARDDEVRRARRSAARSPRRRARGRPGRARRCPGRPRRSRSTSAAVELLAGRVVRAAQPDERARRRPRSRAPRASSASPSPGSSASTSAPALRLATVYSWYVGLAHERRVAAARARAARTARAPRRSRRRRRPGAASTPDVAGDRALERQVRGVGVVVGRDRGEPRDRLRVPGRAPRRACSCRSGRPARRGCPPASGTDSPARARGGCACARSSMLMRSGARSGGRGSRTRPAARSGPSSRTIVGGVDDGVHGVHVAARQRQHGRARRGRAAARAPRRGCSSRAFSIT